MAFGRKNSSSKSSVRSNQASSADAKKRSTLRSRPQGQSLRTPRLGSRDKKPSLRSTSKRVVPRKNVTERTAKRSSQKAASSESNVSTVIKLVLAVIVAVVLVGVLVINLPVFTVKKIIAAPTPHVTQDQIGQLLGVPTGTPLFKVNTDEAINRLKSNPWVEKVSVSRQIPDTLSVHITERVPAGVVIARGGEEAWYISADGVWLEKLNLTGVIGVIADPKVGQDSENSDASSDKNSEDKKSSSSSSSKNNSSSKNKTDEKSKNNSKNSSQTDKKSSSNKKDSSSSHEGEDTQKSEDSMSEADQLLAQAQTISAQAQSRAQEEHLMLIYDIDSTLIPEPGKTVEDSGLSSALWYLRSFNSGLKDQITKIIAPNKSSISIQLKDGVLVALGEPASKEDIELKETVILSLLKLHEGSLTYINVRVPSKPAYRGVGTTQK